MQMIHLVRLHFPNSFGTRGVNPAELGSVQGLWIQGFMNVVFRSLEECHVALKGELFVGTSWNLVSILERLFQIAIGHGSGNAVIRAHVGIVRVSWIKVTCQWFEDFVGFLGSVFSLSEELGIAACHAEIVGFGLVIVLEPKGKLVHIFVALGMKQLALNSILVNLIGDIVLLQIDQLQIPST